MAAAMVPIADLALLKAVWALLAAASVAESL